MRISLSGSDWLFKGFYGEDWAWRNSHLPGSGDRRGWLPGRVPGSVQDDLWRAGQLPDPYFEQNTLACEWASQRTWVYKKVFTLPAQVEGQRVQLHLCGIDYEAEIFLNGERLGGHVGMYTPAVFEVASHLLYGQENLLAVVIQPAPLEQPQVGRTSRVRTHKSRMTYWWDFCPRLVHLGLWQEVYLEVSGPVKIEDVFIQPRLEANFQRAEVSVQVELSAAQAVEAVELGVTLRQAGQVVARQTQQQALPFGPSSQTFRLNLPSPRLWWPNGLGEQPLYEAEVTAGVVGAPEAEIDRQLVTFGIRQISFVPNEEAAPGARPYTLVVNGQRAYIKGWNWVPLDVLYGVPRPEKLERLLRLAQLANVNLLRVWGGGLIETEAFYDLCDRLGILVWQEFIQSSSGIDNIPPDDPAFVEWMAQEAAQIIPLRRNHPALAVWCGGNELQGGPDQPLDDSHPMLAALKEMVARLDPGRHWLPTSPSGPVFGNSLEAIAKDPLSLHDVHGPWEYQGVEKQQALFNAGTSLLHSEFGVEGITNRKTLDTVIARQHQEPVSLDNPYWFHLGAWWVKQPAWKAAFGEVRDVETLARLTQFTQADGLRYALEANRRRKYHNSGSLPWQFNEPYPMAACTSAVDYFGEPKPAYYAVRRAYAPLLLSARFERLAWGKQGEFRASAWVSSSAGQDLAGAVLKMALVKVDGSVAAFHQQAVSFPPDASTHLADVAWEIASFPDEVFFLSLWLAGPEGIPLAQNRYAFTRAADLAPLLRLPATRLQVKRQEKENSWTLDLLNAGKAAAFGVWLEDGRPRGGGPRGGGPPGGPGYAWFEDNYLVLFPNERRRIRVDWQDIPAKERDITISGWNL